MPAAETCDRGKGEWHKDGSLFPDDLGRLVVPLYIIVEEYKRGKVSESMIFVIMFLLDGSSKAEATVNE